MEKRMIGVNERGYRIGEDHRLAILTDSEVQLLRELHEFDGMTYAVLACKFGLSVSAVGKLCRYERRAQRPTGWKEVHVSAKGGAKL